MAKNTSAQIKIIFRDEKAEHLEEAQYFRRLAASLTDVHLHVSNPDVLQATQRLVRHALHQADTFQALADSLGRDIQLRNDALMLMEKGTVVKTAVISACQNLNIPVPTTTASLSNTTWTVALRFTGAHAYLITRDGPSKHFADHLCYNELLQQLH